MADSDTVTSLETEITQVIENGQSVTVSENSRSVNRADLSKLIAAHKYFSAQAGRTNGGARCKIKLVDG